MMLAERGRLSLLPGILEVYRGRLMDHLEVLRLVDEAGERQPALNAAGATLAGFRVALWQTGRQVGVDEPGIGKGSDPDVVNRPVQITDYQLEYCIS